MKKHLLFIIAVIFMSANAFGQNTVTSAQNGDWTQTSTWQGGTVPTASDDVIINHNVRINATGLACANLTVNTGATLRFHSNDASYIFTVNGNFTIDGTFEQHNNQGFPVEIYGDFIVNGVFRTSGQNAAGQSIIMKGNGGTRIGGAGLALNTNDRRFGNLTIDLNSNDAVVALESDIYFLEGEGNDNSKKLTINKGILDFAGHDIHFRKFGQIIVNENGSFGWTHASCDFNDSNLPSIYYDEPCCGSNLKVTGSIYIKDFVATGSNFHFPNNAAATVYVFGTLNKTENNFYMGTGTFVWGPDSWYKSTSNQNQPGGVYAATGGATKTPNDAYEVPDAIQSAIDACSNCTAVNQTLAVSAQNSVVCAGESTSILVENSEAGVIYALFSGSSQTGSDITGTGSQIAFPTGAISASTTFFVKTSAANTVYCSNRRIGGNITVSLASGTTPTATPSTSVSAIPEGDNYSVTLSNFNGSIQWQKSGNEVDWETIDGANSATYSPTTLTGSSNGIIYYFRAKITGGACGDVFSNAVNITVYAAVAPDPKPDLIVADITWTPVPAGTGAQVVFSARVKNQGTLAVSAGTKIGVKFTVNSTYTFCDTYYDGLEAGAEAVLTANGGQNAVPYWTAVEGTYSVDAFADDENLIAELNENNNHFVKTIEILANTDLCDLIVEEITWDWTPKSGECPQRGEDITFSAKIKNTGTAPSPAGVPFGVAFYTNSAVSAIAYNRNYTAS
ncbi:MAG: hypothetical protein LBB53_04190, partial [Prevotellaceae bacterium]|nr:hypothetical protein [Prevotellaceae bacterium]